MPEARIISIQASNVLLIINLQSKEWNLVGLEKKKLYAASISFKDVCAMYLAGGSFVGCLYLLWHQLTGSYNNNMLHQLILVIKYQSYIMLQWLLCCNSLFTDTYKINNQWFLLLITCELNLCYSLSNLDARTIILVIIIIIIIIIIIKKFWW